jgi:hypothetical protein
MTIADYLESLKERLLTDGNVATFDVIRERSTTVDGFIRARLAFVDGSQLEFSEYVQRSGDAVGVITYSYHWSDASNDLIKRWDNAPHHPELHHFPHHIHDGDSGKVTAGPPMSIFTVLDEVAAAPR